MRDWVEPTILLCYAAIADAITTNMLHPTPRLGEASPVIRAAMQLTSPSWHTLTISAIGIVLPLSIYLYLVRVNDHIFARYFIISSILSQTTAAYLNLAALHGHPINEAPIIVWSIAIGITYKGYKLQKKRDKRKKLLENLPQHNF